MTKKFCYEVSTLILDYEKEQFENRCWRAFYQIGPVMIKGFNTFKSRTYLLSLVKCEVERLIKERHPEDAFFKSVFDEVADLWGLELHDLLSPELRNHILNQEEDDPYEF